MDLLQCSHHRTIEFDAFQQRRANLKTVAHLAHFILVQFPFTGQDFGRNQGLAKIHKLPGNLRRISLCFIQSHFQGDRAGQGSNTRRMIGGMGVTAIENSH